MKKYITGHRIFLLCIDLCLLGFVAQLPEIPQSGRSYPMFFIILSLILCNILLFRKKQVEPEKISDKSVVFQIILFTIVSFVSILLMQKIGYILSTLFFLFCGELALKVKVKSILFWALPIVLTLVIYLVFTRVLSVMLPSGDWFGISF